MGAREPERIERVEHALEDVVARKEVAKRLIARSNTLASPQVLRAVWDVHAVHLTQAWVGHGVVLQQKLQRGVFEEEIGRAECRVDVLFAVGLVHAFPASLQLNDPRARACIGGVVVATRSAVHALSSRHVASVEECESCCRFDNREGVIMHRRLCESSCTCLVHVHVPVCSGFPKYRHPTLRAIRSSVLLGISLVTSHSGDTITARTASRN